MLFSAWNRIDWRLAKKLNERKKMSKNKNKYNTTGHTHMFECSRDVHSCRYLITFSKIICTVIRNIKQFHSRLTFRCVRKLKTKQEGKRYKIVQSSHMTTTSIGKWTKKKEQKLNKIKRMIEGKYHIIVDIIRDERKNTERRPEY